MSLGVSILVSAFLLSIVILYVTTKDRWNWKKIFLFPLLALVVLVLGAFVVFSISYWSENRPRVVEELWGLKLGMEKADVLFLKGKPDKKGEVETDSEGVEDCSWFYLDPWTKITGESQTKIRVQFRDNNVQFVMVSSNASGLSPRILRIKPGATMAEVQKKFGPPSDTSHSPNDLQRVICYDKYKVFFAFSQNALYSYGIYEPEFGALGWHDDDDESDETGETEEG